MATIGSGLLSTLQRSHRASGRASSGSGAASRPGHRWHVAPVFCAQANQGDDFLVIGEDDPGFCPGSAGSTCTLYIGVYAHADVNNVTLPPRHWYAITIEHIMYDTSDLLSGERRLGCLRLLLERRLGRHARRKLLLDGTQLHARARTGSASRLRGWGRCPLGAVGCSPA